MQKCVKLKIHEGDYGKTQETCKIKNEKEATEKEINDARA
jgi:hypothetical protein